MNKTEQSILRWGKQVKEGSIDWKTAAENVLKETGEALSRDAIRKRYDRVADMESVPPSEFFDQKADGSVEVSSNIWVNKNFKKTPDNVLEILGYDKELWSLQTFRVGSHEVAISDEDENRVCYNFRAILKPTEQLLSSNQAVEISKKIFEGKIIPFKFKQEPRLKGNSKDKMLFLPALEGHIGKEDPNIFKERFFNVYNDFVHLQIQEKADTCVIGFGNDLFNSETNGRTHKGTEQYNVIEPADMFEVGIECYTKAIVGLKEFFNNVYILFYAGNHATDMEKMALRSLKNVFREDMNVAFLDDEDFMNVFQFGDTMLVGHHGDINYQRMINSISSGFPKIYGDTIFRYVVAGHLHKNDMRYEESGITFMRTSSISDNKDAFHTKQRFGVGGVPKQEMYVFSSVHGLIGSKVVVFRKPTVRVR